MKRTIKKLTVEASNDNTIGLFVGRLHTLVQGVGPGGMQSPSPSGVNAMLYRLNSTAMENVEITCIVARVQGEASVFCSPAQASC